MKLKLAYQRSYLGEQHQAFGIPLKQGLEFMFKAINEGSVPAPYDTPGIAGKKVSFFSLMKTGGSTKQVAEFKYGSKTKS